jgi:GMP reductase
VLECSEAAKNAGGFTISDGGIIHPCDVSKAFGAGADFVMCGSIFAGHIESPGEIIEDNLTQQKYKRFYGMSSETANNKYNNGLQKYRSAEGKEVIIQLKGSLHDTVQDLNGAVRSTCTYTNSHSVEQLDKNTRFILVNNHHNTSL